MGTLKVDNLQKRDGTALITDGVAQTNLLTETALRNAGIGMVKLSHSTASGASSIEFGDTLITDNYLEYYIVSKLIFSANAGLQFQISPDNGTTNSYTTTFSFQHHLVVIRQLHQTIWELVGVQVIKLVMFF